MRYGFDYQRAAKLGFFLGLTLFVGGAAGELIGRAILEPMPGWLDTLLFDVEVVGLLTGFFSPIVFGIVAPLTE